MIRQLKPGDIIYTISAMHRLEKYKVIENNNGELIASNERIPLAIKLGRPQVFFLPDAVEVKMHKTLNKLRGE